MFAAGLLSIGASGGSKTSVEGLVHTGEQHQRQCKMLNPVLDVVHLRRLGIPQTRLDFYQSNPRTWGQVPLFKGDRGGNKTENRVWLPKERAGTSIGDEVN
jgi:hypothetical protein